MIDPTQMEAARQILKTKTLDEIEKLIPTLDTTGRRALYEAAGEQWNPADKKLKNRHLVAQFPAEEVAKLKQTRDYYRRILDMLN